MSDHIGDTHEMVKGYVEARVTRTEEIRARVESEVASELRFRVEVRNDEVLLRRKLHSGVSVGSPRSFAGTRVLELWSALITSRTELQALREENARLTKSLAAAGAYFPAAALEVVNLRQENAQLQDIAGNQTDRIDALIDESCKLQDDIASIVSTHRADWSWEDVVEDVRRLAAEYLASKPITSTVILATPLTPEQLEANRKQQAEYGRERGFDKPGAPRL